MPAFGRLASPDPRDRNYPMRAALEPHRGPLATKRTYRIGPVLDQGDTPQCVGFSWRQWLSSEHIFTLDGPSPDAIYHAAQKVDEWPGTAYDGTSVRAGVKVLDTLGHVEQYLWAWDIDTVADWLLLDKGTIVFGTDWYSGMTDLDAEHIAHPSGSHQGGHAYLCIGIDTQRGLVEFVNSWGVTWGRGGRFWMDMGDVQKLLSKGGEACTAIECEII